MISFKLVNKSYGSIENETIALRDISFRIRRGEVAVILGPSGSGKSTIMNIIGGVDIQNSGEVIVDDINLALLKTRYLTKYRKDKIGFVFQFYNLIPSLTVFENIELVYEIAENPLEIDYILKAVGLFDKKDKFPGDLSGGEKQRVAIARALLKKPKVLLCDEPTGALDYNCSKEVLLLLETVNKEFNTTVVIVTHNTAIAKMADRVISLRCGEVAKVNFNRNPLSAEEIYW